MAKTANQSSRRPLSFFRALSSISRRPEVPGPTLPDLQTLSKWCSLVSKRLMLQFLMLLHITHTTPSIITSRSGQDVLLPLCSCDLVMPEVANKLTSVKFCHGCMNDSDLRYLWRCPAQLGAGCLTVRGLEVLFFLVGVNWFS